MVRPRRMLRQLSRSYAHISNFRLTYENEETALHHKVSIQPETPTL